MSLQWRHFQTLRFRLTALYTAVFGFLLVLLCTAVLIARERDLREQFDERLKDRAEIIVEEITVPYDSAGVGAESAARIRRLNPFRFPGYFFQLRLADDTVVERSYSLTGRSLPLSDVGLRSRDTDQPVLETLKGAVVDEILEPGASMRLLTLFRNDPETQPFFLQMGVSTAPMERSIHRLRRIVALAVPSVLVIGGIASWLLAGRSLAPIARVAEVADELHADRFTTRFDTPDTKNEVANMIAKINSMLDRLSNGFLSHERFIADAAHELKTPLAVLLGEAQVLMQQDRSAEEYARFVANLQDEVRAFAQTVDGLLMLARAEAGIPMADVSLVSLNEMVMDAVQQCSPLAVQREVRLVPTLALPEGADIEAAVSGDGALLRLMVANLIRNAIRYSPPDEAVDVTLRLAPSEATIVVRDRGPGIPAEFLDRVFDRFFCVPDPHSSFKGVGLGLAIARGVARLHGGDVQVTNHAQGGCEFVVYLPGVSGGERSTMPTVKKN